MEKLKIYLETLAKRKAWYDKMEDGSTIVDDFAGGNVDDAYEGGCRDGEISLARELLVTYFKGV